MPNPISTIPFRHREGPVGLVDSKGEKHAVTFSMDSEQTNADVYGLLRGNKDVFEQFLKSPKGAALASHDLSRTFLAQELSVPRRRINTIFEEDVDLSRSNFSFTDLRPVWFGRLIGENSAHFTDRDALLLVENLLQALGLEVRVERDANRLEIKHASWEMLPRTFADLLVRLEKAFPHHSTHLHLGLPTAAISLEKAILISNILEMRVGLGLAIRSDWGEYLQPNMMGSSFWTRQAAARGFVYLHEDFFYSPEKAYDLELRQLNGLTSGLKLLNDAAMLAEENERLIEGSIEHGRQQIVTQVGNLIAYLSFAAEVVERSGEPAAARALLERSGELLAEKRNSPRATRIFDVSAGLQKKVRRTLREHHIIERISENESFLHNPRSHSRIA